MSYTNDVDRRIAALNREVALASARRQWVPRPRRPVDIASTIRRIDPDRAAEVADELEDLVRTGAR